MKGFFYIKRKQLSDHNFDDIAQKYITNIYGTSKGKIREVIVWDELLTCLEMLPTRKLRILDAGGGFGFFSQKLAALDHDVLLCDISSVMLAEAKKQIDAAQLQQNITIVHCAIEDLPVELQGSFDLILNHAVLSWLEKPKQTLHTLLKYLSETGVLSLMFYNKEAQRFHNLVSGNFEFVAKGMLGKKVVKLTPTAPLYPTDVIDWLAEFKMKIIAKTGVRVLHDYLKERQLCDDKFALLLQAEQQYCHQEPYASLGRYMHLTLNRK